MTTEELALILTARFDQLDTAFGHVEKVLDKYAKNAVDANAEASTAFLASTAAITGAGYALTTFMGQAVMSAARSEELDIVLYNMGKTIGMTATEIDSAVASIAALGISQNSAKESALRFIQANLDVADAVKLARAAQDLAVISGQNSSDTFNNLTTAIVTQRTELLMQVGIMQGVEKIFSEYGKTVGVAAKNLTETQKRQAILNTILAAGAKAAGNYESAMGSGFKMLGSMKRLLEDVSKTIGDVYLPAFNAAITPVYKLTDAFTKSSPLIKTSIALTLGLGTAYVALAAAMRVLMITLPGLVTAFSTFNAALLANPLITGAAAAVFATVAVMGLFDRSIKEAERDARALNAALNETAKMTMSEVKDISDPVARLRATKAVLAARKEELAQGSQLTEYARTQLKAEISRAEMLMQNLKPHEQELALLDAKKKKLAENTLSQEAFNKAVTKAHSDMRDDFKQFVFESKVKEETQVKQLQFQIHALEEYRKRYKGNAVKLAAVDKELAETRKEAALAAIEKERQARKQMYDATIGAFASSLTSELDVFNLHALKMVDIWHSMVNQMVQILLKSAILDFFVMLGFGGGGGNLSGLLSGILGGGSTALPAGLPPLPPGGFDDPVNDAMARSAGSNKWFQDFANNFSGGYVNSALKTGPTMMAPATGGGGVTYVQQSTISLGPPSDMRKALRQLKKMDKRSGWR